jgi:ferrous iron transport protein B
MWCITAYPVKPRYDVDAARAAGHVQVITEDGGSAAPAPPGVEPITASQLANRRAAEALRYSLAGRIGGALEPVLAPLGFDWKIGTALIGAFAAKEVFVAQMGIIYAMGETDEGSSDLQATLRRDYSPVVGVSLMLFLLIATPCMATVAVMRRESGGWKWPLVQFGGLTAIAYLLSLLVYQLGRLLA